MDTQTPQPPYTQPQQQWTPPAPRPQRPFYRPSNGRMLGGVCAAVADYFGWDRTVVRLLTAVSVVLPGPQVLAYVIAWALIPSEERYWERQAASTQWAPPQQQPEA